MINPARANYGNTPAERIAVGWNYRPEASSAVPQVSIISPFYNTGSEFNETAAVVLNQSFQNWEWIVVNDCSTDAEALHRLQVVRDSDPRVRVIDLPENQGPSHARNIGIQQARAGYIFQLDSDDLIEPTAIEKLLWFLEVNPHLSFARGYDVGFGAESYLWTRGFHCGSEFLSENIVQTNSLVRKQVFLTTGGYDESLKHGYEDWDFWLRCASQGLWGDTLPEYLHWYRRRSSHSDKWKEFESAARKETFRQALLQRHEGLTALTFPKLAVRTPAHYGTPALRSVLKNPLAKSSRRLLFIVPHLEMGGADKFNLDLIRQLKERHGWEITVVTTLSNATAWYHLFTELTSDVFVLHNFLHLADYPAFFVYLISSRRYDAVLTSNSTYGYNLLPLFRSVFPTLPVLDYVHMEEEYWKSGGYARFSVNYAPFLDGTVVSSHHLRDWMIERGHQAEAITVAYTNIDPQAWQRDGKATEAALTRWNLNRSACRILFAGRLCEQKQPDVFSQVARALLGEGLNVQFIVAGDGPCRPEYAQAASQYPPDLFRLVGAVSSVEVRELLGCSHIFFLPSKMEGIALVMFESMSMETVPVGANVGGQAELVKPDCGVLIERGGDEVQKYCAALRELLSDEPRREQMAKNCRARIVKHHALDRLGETMHGLLTAAIDRRRADGTGDLLQGNHALAELFILETTEQQRLEQTAHALWVERNQWPAGKRNGRSTEVVVFMNLGRGYNEQDTVKREIEPSKDLDLWILLPHPIAGGRLRIDPISCMGTITLSGIYLRWKAENIAFWKADTPAELADALECSGTSLVISDGLKFQILSYGEDPMIILPQVAPPDPTAQVMVHLIYRFDPHLSLDLIQTRQA